MAIHWKSLILGTLLMAVAARPGAAQTGLLQSIRNNNLVALRAAAAKKADMNALGPRDVTPLMHAAAFGSVEAMQILLDSGADVDAKDAFGATALIWAAGDAAKARLLIERGADVNAQTKLGRTALIVAAAHDGNIETVRLLLAEGADVGAHDSEGSTAIMTAAFADAPDTVKLLLAYGADAKEADGAGFTPLHQAAANGNPEMMRLLLSKGADVNAANSFGGEVKFGQIALKELTPLMHAAPHGGPEDIGVLLKAGAAVNARDSRGMTALMFAVASENQDVRVVKKLLAADADVNARSTAGETVLDWARKVGNPKVIAALEKLGAKSGSAAKTAPAVGKPETTVARNSREAVERGVALLQNSSTEFFRQSGCVGCHHQPMTQIAVAAAREAGVAVDESAARDTSKAIVASWDILQAAMLEGMDGPAPPDIQISSTFALAAEKVPPGLVTDTLAANVAARQRRDGSWKLTGFTRAPMEESHFARTAMSLRTLQVYGTPGLRLNFEQRVSKAREWLEKTKPRTTDDHVWRLVGLYWSGSGTATIKSSAGALRKLQRADGGWASNENLGSNPFSTGTALWALWTVRALGVADDPYRRGSEYLLRAQHADGSWHVDSRAPKFQPYFESGFPHGGDQWISAAATAWATVALAPTVDIAVSESDKASAPRRIAWGPSNDHRKTNN